MSVHMLNNSHQTSTTRPSVTVQINAKAWHEGWTWSLNGGSSFDNPYPLGSTEAYSWVTGFIGRTGQAANQ